MSKFVKFGNAVYNKDKILFIQNSTIHMVGGTTNTITDSHTIDDIITILNEREETELNEEELIVVEKRVVSTNEEKWKLVADPHVEEKEEEVKYYNWTTTDYLKFFGDLDECDGPSDALDRGLYQLLVKIFCDTKHTLARMEREEIQKYLIKFTDTLDPDVLQRILDTGILPLTKYQGMIFSSLLGQGNHNKEVLEEWLKNNGIKHSLYDGRSAEPDQYIESFKLKH